MQEVEHGSTVKTGCHQAAGKTETPVAMPAEEKKAIHESLFPEIDEKDAKKQAIAKTAPYDQQVKWERTASGGGRFDGLSADMLQAWSTAFRAVDIDAEILRAQLWLVANPSKMKRNLYRFLTNWLAKCQERGGSRFFGQDGSIHGSWRQNAATGNSRGFAVGQIAVSHGGNDYSNESLKKLHEERVKKEDF
jgi:hypothetical protein